MTVKGLAENQRVFKAGLIVFPEEGGGVPHLLGSRCNACGTIYFPAKRFCAECMNETMTDILFGNEGKLYTKTVVHIGVKGFATPYVLGWVDLPEGIRLATQIDCDPQDSENLQPGQKLELVVGTLRTLPDGTEIVGYKYRPITGIGDRR